MICAVVLGAFGSLVVAALVIVVIAAAMSGRAADPPTADETECLVVATTVETASCGADGAQRVIAELSSGQTCPADTGTLTTGSTTWCLEPIEP